MGTKIVNPIEERLLQPENLLNEPIEAKTLGELISKELEKKFKYTAYTDKVKRDILIYFQKRINELVLDNPEDEYIDNIVICERNGNITIKPGNFATAWVLSSKLTTDEFINDGKLFADVMF